MSEATANLSRAKRNVTVLVLAQALIGAQMPMIFTVGGLAGQSLASNACLATLPISLIVLGSMLSATPMSAIMQRYGRRVGFYIGAFGGCAGAIVGAAGLYYSSFSLFLLGSLLTGVYMSAQGFYRFAATDAAPAEFQAKAISYVMAGGLVAALVARELVVATSDAFIVPFLGTYLTVVAVNIAALALFAFIDIPTPPAPGVEVPKGRSRLEMLRTPRIAVAIICAAVSYALMNLIMTSTPLAVVGCGFETDDAATVVLGHVVAMFAPSFVTGHLINRFGVEKIVASGLAILASAGMVGMAGVALENFYITLILLGIGWNFGFIGATAMLAQSHRPEERGRIQGMNDLIVFGCVTIASVASGGLMNCSGGTPQEGWFTVNMAMAPLLMLAGGALIWLVLRPEESRA